MSKPQEITTLKPGDTVDIVAPSCGCHLSVLEKVKALLDSWGLNCYIPHDLMEQHLHFAHTDEKRLSHLEYALSNQDSKAIWCLVGGYGAIRLIPGLLQHQPATKQKLLIGMSDTTALHLFLQQKWGWPTVHASSARMVSLDKVNSESVNQIKRLLFGLDPIMVYEDLKPLNHQASVYQNITGKLIGGNLTLIQTSLGTPWHIDARDKILFIEEYNERSYRMDRSLEHLKQAGAFENIKALLFGDMIDIPEVNGQSLIKETLAAFADDCSFPVFQIQNVGHGFTNQPLLLGANTQIQVSKTIRLSVARS